MNRPIRIRFAGMESTSELYAAAHSLAHGLTWDHSEIIECWVGIRLDPEVLGPEPRYSVRVDVTVPGHELIAKGVRQENLDLALDHAFADMQIQLAGINPRIHHAEYAVTTAGELLPPEDLAEEKRYGERRSSER